MDLQTRKIEFVQAFLKLQSEKAISHLETLLKKESEHSESDIQPMSEKDYHNRISKSIDDSKNDRVIEADDLLSEIEKWS